MFFRPVPKQTIYIQNKSYAFESNPSAPTYVYGQEGRHGIVYHLTSDDNTKFAFKVFHYAYRGDWVEIISTSLRKYCHLPGMRAADRQILSQKNAFDLLNKYPELEFSVLMPWIKGYTCLEIFLSHKPLSKLQSISLALQLAKTLTSLEKNGLAHSDISASNVIVNLESFEVDLTGIESFYMDHIAPPPMLPLGSHSYVNPKFQTESQWCSTGDRFAGAMLISELLTWYNEEIRLAAYGESYFSPHEIGEPNDKKHLLISKLKMINSFFVSLFDQAWNARSYDECPKLELWHEYLAEVISTQY